MKLPVLYFRSLLLPLSLSLSFSSVQAAEMGRHSVSSGIPTTQSYEQSSWMDAQTGIEIGVDFLKVRWDVGSTSLDDAALAPMLGLVYRANPSVDLRAGLSFFSVEDQAGEMNYDLDVLQVGLGARYWFSRETDFSPVLGVALNYLSLDSDAVADLDGTLGINAELGVAYQGIDNLQIQAALTGGTSLLDSEGMVGGEKFDVNLSSLGVGVRVIFLF
ncbi:MAG: outer membrane beta-barrel protein [Verrucomicrobia bacterium]|nr:outer membrane beta-barrel protein [Kiritimatiellia bacterium]MCB1102221.1 outer membrane beta-barrel protein [Kiritimatiellia bacterium]MCP5488840.1 outer membrane beta-barrel protein [Verrucomicrobiota bacterium]